jgi:hypothetical protein
MYHDEDFTSGWNDNDILFVLDQHSELDFYIATSLKQQSMDRRMSPYSDTLSLFWANQSLLFLLNAARLGEKLQIPIS